MPGFSNLQGKLTTAELRREMVLAYYQAPKTTEFDPLYLPAEVSEYSGKWPFPSALPMLERLADGRVHRKLTAYDFQYSFGDPWVLTEDEDDKTVRFDKLDIIRAKLGQMGAQDGIDTNYQFQNLLANACTTLNSTYQSYLWQPDGSYFFQPSTSKHYFGVDTVGWFNLWSNANGDFTSGNSKLNYDNVHQMRANIMKCPNDQGFRMGLRPDILIYGPGNTKEALEVLTSPERPDSANRATNTVQSLKLSGLELSYLPDGYWGLAVGNALAKPFMLMLHNDGVMMSVLTPETGSYQHDHDCYTFGLKRYKEFELGLPHLINMTDGS